jgi:hypothetical protein
MTTVTVAALYVQVQILLWALVQGTTFGRAGSTPSLSTKDNNE